MKKIFKLLPAAFAVCLLVGCSNQPTLNDGEKPIVGGTGSEGLELDTYQDLFDDLYESKGVEVAVDELLYRVAKYVLSTSENWTEAQIEAELAERVEAKFDSFYTASYKVNGLFDESKLVLHLQSLGHTIEIETPFKETVTNLVGHGHLQSYLTGDYSDYIEELEKDLYIDLLKEEYVLTQRASASATYYTNKDVRKVQFFSYTPANSSEASKYAQLFQNAVDASIEAQEDFKTLVTKDGGLEEQWKLKQLEDLAKDFAMINAKAAGFKGATPSAVNEDSEYPLPTKYANEVKAFELKYADDTVYGFRDIYTTTNYDSTEKSEVTSKLNSFSNNGTQSIYKGYYQKQLEIISANYLTEKVSTSDHSSVISSTVNKAIEDMDSLYKDTGYVDVYETETAVFKNGSVYYILHVEEIKDSSSLDLKKEAAEALAGVSSNVKNAIYYYLTSLTEEGKLTINNQDIYDYLNETYSYGEED